MKNKLVLLIIIFASLFACGNLFSQVTKTIKVTNTSGFPVMAVRYSLTGTFDWGFELNVNGRVNNNTSFEFSRKIDTTICLYDFKFTDEAGKDYIMEKVDLCKSTAVSLTVPEEKSEAPKDETKPDMKTEEK
jgi:hypothetical protein